MRSGPVSFLLTFLVAGTSACGSDGNPPGAGGDAASGGSASSSGGGASAAGGRIGAGGGNGAGGAPVSAPDLSHTFDDMTVGPGEEVIGRCQSWTLNNDAPLFVQAIEASNEGAFHHSNWIWVPENLYVGPDGTWPCSERGFDQILAGAVGGVFFAQSTQSRADTQSFPEGVAFEVPARSRIVGDVHLLNPSDTATTTRLSFAVDTIPESEVRVRLQPMAYTNLALDIAPAMRTSARMQCPTPQPDFDVYYVLPHFHTLATAMRVDVAGGPMSGTNLFTTAGSYGESLGQMFDPPLSVTGAAGLVFTCDYDNPRSSTVRYGFGDQEMCVALVYATGRKAGGEAISNLTVSDVGGVHQTDGFCIAAAAP